MASPICVPFVSGVFVHSLAFDQTDWDERDRAQNPVCSRHAGGGVSAVSRCTPNIRPRHSDHCRRHLQSSSDCCFCIDRHSTVRVWSAGNECGHFDSASVETQQFKLAGSVVWPHGSGDYLVPLSLWRDSAGACSLFYCLQDSRAQDPAEAARHSVGRFCVGLSASDSGVDRFVSYQPDACLRSGS